jgi:hypothetical protein
MNAKKCKALRGFAEAQTVGKAEGATRDLYRLLKRDLKAKNNHGQTPKLKQERRSLDYVVRHNKFQGFRKVRKFDSERGITRWMPV